MEIKRVQNLSDTRKEEKLQVAMTHLQQAAIQRQFYQAEVLRAKSTPRSELLVLSFDYAQNIHYPSSFSTTGSAYFKVARKASLFGINNEGATVQYTYVIDEAHQIGKGPNTVISMLHHFLETEPKTKELVLFADNCVSQNKNNTMIQYLDWRVRTNREKKVSLDFLLVGHTKFAPDRTFGLIKTKYTRVTVDTYNDLIQCAVEASPAGHSIAVKTYDPMTEEELMPWYRWDNFFPPFYKNFKGITKYQHFSFTRNEVGDGVVAACCRYADSPLETFEILRVETTGNPEQITPPGLSVDRQWYLYSQIRPLCKNPKKQEQFIPKPKGKKQPKHSTVKKPVPMKSNHKASALLKKKRK